MLKMKKTKFKYKETNKGILHIPKCFKVFHIHIFSHTMPVSFHISHMFLVKKGSI